MSPVHTNGNDVDIDIARLFVAIWERRLAIISLMLIVCTVAFVVSGTIAPRYRAESRVLIEAREPGFSEANRNERGQAQYLDEQGIGSQVEIINSTNLIKSVAEQLRLVDDPEFSAAAKPPITTSILIMLGVSGDPYDIPPEERLIETFRDHLSVYQVSNTRVIAISFWSINRQLSARVANAIADAYLNVQSGAKLISNADTTAWLEPEIADLRDKVRDAEAKVAEYRAQSGLLLVDETATIATQQLAEISTELSRVRANRAEAQARATAVAKAIEDGYSTEQFANSAQSEVIRRLRERQASLQSNIADLSVTLLDGHPRIKGLRSQLSDIDLQIKAEAKNLLRGFENEAEVAQLRENELVAQLDLMKADSARAGGEEVELRALEREARAQRELLEAYLSRYREAASRSDRGNLPADARVISVAQMPINPYFPKPVPIVIIAGLATFLLASIIIMMRELFSGRAMKSVDYGKPAEAAVQTDQVENPESAPYIHQREKVSPVQDVVVDTVPDMPDETDGPIIKTLPDDLDEPIIEVAEKLNLVPHPDVEFDTVPITEIAETDTPVTETDRHVLISETDTEYSVSAITGHLIAAGTRIAVVVSPEGDKGSTTSVMLARMLANEGKQTLLVDMTGSACPSRMMVPQIDLPGITNILADECTVPEALHADRLSNAHILPQGTVDPSAAMHYADRLPAIIGVVSNVYEIVVVECGPANSAGVKRLLDDHDVEMIFSVVQPEEQVITEYLTDFFSEGFKHLLMMSPGAGTPERPDRSAA